MTFLNKNHPRWPAGALIGLVLLFAARSSAGARPYLPPQPLPTATFIDMHCHTAGIGAGGSGCFLSASMMQSYKLRFYLQSFGVTKAEIEREGDGLVITRLSERLAASQHVGRAVVLALDGVVDAQGQLDRAATEIYVPNEFLAAEIPKHPNLLWGASVNPYRPDALARLEWARAHGAVLVKWLPSVMHIDPADERLVPFYRKLAELGLPLLTHTGNERSFTQALDKYCDPDRLRLPLRCGVTVIAAHAATTGEFHGERSIDRLVRLLPDNPRLFVDLSSLTQVNKLGYLGEVLQRPEFHDRVLYGTDYPLVAINALVAPWYQARHLALREMWRISGVKNIWDRDVALKQALGVPTDVWTRAEKILALHPVAAASANPKN